MHQRRINRGRIRTVIRLAGNTAFAIIGAGFASPGQFKFIGFLLAHCKRYGFGGLAKGNRKNTACQRVKRAAMTRLCSIKNPAHNRHGLGRTYALWFIKVNPAMNWLSAFACHRTISLGGWRQKARSSALHFQSFHRAETAGVECAANALFWQPVTGSEVPTGSRLAKQPRY